MQINITKKDYSKEIHMEINTGNTCDPIEKDVIKECLAELNLDSSYNKRNAIKAVSAEVKQMLMRIKK
jgi:L-serine deaminase